ncbi:MAG TPA: SRPBCC family protein [Pseudonocardiaceae bacterium]|jgi:uncharacterized protein YndB with AHSA1/START domain|nr:SRPBCC family protein [Pseudonocardiaceae bacterium]
MAVGRAVRSVAASPSAVWAVLADHLDIATWLPGLAVSLEREGMPAPGGVGAIRVITGPRTTMREEITTFEPNHTLAYRGLSGLPLPDWTGQVELAELGSDTVVRWSISARASFPGADLLLSGAAQALLFSLVRSVRRHAAAG